MGANLFFGPLFVDMLRGERPNSKGRFLPRPEALLPKTKATRDLPKIERTRLTAKDVCSSMVVVRAMCFCYEIFVLCQF